METKQILKDIGKRCQGDIYLGIVGPVRSGKSTFIKRFMEMAVIPYIEDPDVKIRTIDELPQSGKGKMIMTVEPKFIPNQAVKIDLQDDFKINVRLVDCVGYVIEGASGYQDDSGIRLVKTPWYNESIPFDQAAKIGTKKVIEEHSTIGILITTDGSITDIPRDDYVKAEERVVSELRALHKPFIILLNSLNPSSPETRELAIQLSDKYNTKVMPISCEDLTADDINSMFASLLYEFPVDEIKISFPKWIDGLEYSHPLKAKLFDQIKNAFTNVSALKDVSNCVSAIDSTDIISKTFVNNIMLGSGKVCINITLKDELFYNVLSEITGIQITNEGELFSIMSDLSCTKKKYDKIAYALEEVKTKGYGIVTPSIDELVLEEPEMVKQGSRFGVKLRATAPSIHMIRANIETEVSPIVGSEKQSEELVNYLLSGFENDPTSIWESNIFGKSLHELVNEGLQAKLAKMPEEAQFKLQETLERIVNEGSGGLICIIL